MKKIDDLLRRAKQATGDWKPDTYTVTKLAGRYRVLRTLWNGVAGSLNPGYLDRHKISPCHEEFFDSQEEARQWIAADVAAFEKAHCMKLSPAPKVFNCCVPETDAERKALWKEQGGTVMEYLAENAGLSLEAYIRQEHGEEKLAWYADIIRWRKEDGIDAEKTVEAVNAEGSSAGNN